MRDINRSLRIAEWEILLEERARSVRVKVFLLRFGREYFLRFGRQNFSSEGFK